MFGIVHYKTLESRSLGVSGTSTIRPFLDPFTEAGLGVMLLGREMETTQMENKVACGLLRLEGLL